MLLLSAALFFTACNDDDNGDSPSFQALVVSAPSSIPQVETGDTDQSIDFTVSVDPNLTATYAATGAGVTIDNPSGDVTGGTITITYDVGNTPGAGAITVTVTDSEGQTDNATAAISIIGEETEVLVASNITGDATWTPDKVYILGGRIAVEDGATLTIEPGTIIKGEAGTGANASALLIVRGGTLIADGSADAPIIFTSIADEIMPEDVAGGNFISPNLDPDANGFWGGLLVLGRAPISAPNDDVEAQIEGIPTTDVNGRYGGTDPGDNSGTIRYVSVRHGGSNIGEGNEINGISFGGVGNGTTVSWVEVVGNQDDGIEWFGGTVDVDNALVWNAGDDAIDTDQAWGGTLDNFVVITPNDRSFELDGPEGTPNGNFHTIRNGSVVASDLANENFSGDLINMDANSEVDLENIFITGIRLDPAQQINRTEAPDGSITFDNVILDVPAGDLDNHIDGTNPGGISAGQSPQADLSGFGWSWTSQSSLWSEIQ
jgi:hypothetical protein